MSRWRSPILPLGAAAILSIAVCVRNTRAASAAGYSFTPAQAARGRALYAARCAVCHGARMDGVDETPALVGARFDSHWRTRPTDLFIKVKLSMPQDNPGSLSSEQAADIVAAILAANRVVPS